MKYVFVLGWFFLTTLTSVLWLQLPSEAKTLFPPTTERVSLMTGGVQGSGAFEGGISTDGRYALFVTGAPYIPEDTNNQIDVYIYDRLNQTTEIVSIASDGTQGNNLSYRARMSADGRFVTFASHASNLVPNDTNNTVDIFIHDRETHSTERVSIADDESQATAMSDGKAQTSADGRYVVFLSAAPNLVEEDTNNRIDVFVRDRLLNQTERVSIASDGTQFNQHSSFIFSPDISSDGRFVLFSSQATNLVSTPTTGFNKIFVHDRQTGQTTLESINQKSIAPNGNSNNGTISNDGRYVVFSSNADNLVPNDTNSKYDIFLKDRNSQGIMLVTQGYDGTPANLDSDRPYISGNGNIIVFQSDANNLIPNDGNECEPGDELCGEVYVLNRLSTEVRRVSIGYDGNESDGFISSPEGISTEGRYIVFSSDSSNIVIKDTNNTVDVFLYDQGEEILLTPTPSNTPTPTVTASITPSPSHTSSATATYATYTITPSSTPSPSQTATVTATVTSSVTPSATASSTPSFSHTPTPTVTETLTPTYTITPSSTPSPDYTPTTTVTATALPNTPTATNTQTSVPPSQTPTVTRTATTTTLPHTPTPIYTQTPVLSSPTSTVSPTATGTALPTVTASTTLLPSVTSTATPSVTVTTIPSVTATATNTSVPATMTMSPTATLFPTATATLVPQYTVLYLPLIQYQ